MHRMRTAARRGVVQDPLPERLHHPGRRRRRGGVQDGQRRVRHDWDGWGVTAAGLANAGIGAAPVECGVRQGGPRAGGNRRHL